MIRARRTSRCVEVDRFNTRRSSACCSTETIRGRTFRAMLQGYQVTPVLNSYLRDTTLDSRHFAHRRHRGSRDSTVSFRAAKTVEESPAEARESLCREEIPRLRSG